MRYFFQLTDTAPLAEEETKKLIKMSSNNRQKSTVLLESTIRLIGHAMQKRILTSSMPGKCSRNCDTYVIIDCSSGALTITSVWMRNMIV